ncbi:MAG: nucleotide exchange factor GrpE [Verrucomicrobiota bacterium]
MQDDEVTEINTEKEETDQVEIDTSADVEFVEEDGEGNTKSSEKKLKEKLAKALEEKQEYLNNWQRERADFQNYKKDETARLLRNRELATERFIEDLLPVLDAYDMAFANKDAWEKVEKNWRVGVEYIHQQLLKVLAENGVTPIDGNVGDVFDHNLHESIESVETDDSTKDHTLAQIIQSGYKIGERILRPVRVKVFAIKQE